MLCYKPHLWLVSPDNVPHKHVVRVVVARLVSCRGAFTSLTHDNLMSLENAGNLRRVKARRERSHLLVRHEAPTRTDMDRTGRSARERGAAARRIRQLVCPPQHQWPTQRANALWLKS